jgi:hypothetical protein
VKVNVKVPATVVIIEDGLHEPLMPLFEVVGKKGGDGESCTRGPICVNVGVIGAVTITFIVAVVAHWPAFGVNVEGVVPAVPVLIEGGSHEPAMPFVEVPGRTEAILPWHNGPIWEKVGVIEVVTTISIVAVDAHWPAAGVKV